MGYAKLRKREYENKMGGYWGEERLRHLYHFLKRPVPVYQLLVYPLIGHFFNVRKWNREVSCKRKSWTSLNFRVYAWPFIHCLYFIYARKFYTSTACKNYATVDIHLKTANANHACDFDEYRIKRCLERGRKLDRLLSLAQGPEGKF